MNEVTFLQNFKLVANAPGGVQRLRELVLQLAAMGRLVQRVASEGDSEPLVAAISNERERLADEGGVRLTSPLPDVDPGSQSVSVPDHWRWIRLGNLTSKIGSGSTPRGGSKVYVSDGVPFLRSQNIWNDGVRLDDVVFISAETHAKMRNTHVLPNDILLNITGASLGRCAIAPVDFPAANVSQHVTIIRPLLTETRRFLHICLLSPFGQGMIWGRQVGMAREGLSKKVLEQFEIPLPPLEEQKRIVAKVDELMRLCDRLEAQQQEREKLLPLLSRANHSRLVTEPTEANLNALFQEKGSSDLDHLRNTILALAVSGRFAAIEEERSAHEVLDEIARKRQRTFRPSEPPATLRDSYALPSTWCWARFEDVAVIASNLVHPKDYLDLPHLAPDNVEKATGVLLPCRTVREDKVTSANHRFFSGQIVYSKIRPNLSKVVLVDFDGLCSADMYPISPLIDPGYLHLFMLSEQFLGQAVRSDTRVAMPKINQKELNAVVVPVPPLNEQRHIVATVSRLAQVLWTLREQRKTCRKVAESFAIAAVAQITSTEFTENDRMKPPQTEVLTALKVGKKPKKPDAAPLATLLSEQKSEASAKTLWLLSGLEIDAFYRQLKTEMANGWIDEDKDKRAVKEVEVR